MAWYCSVHEFGASHATWQIRDPPNQPASTCQVPLFARVEDGFMHALSQKLEAVSTAIGEVLIEARRPIQTLTPPHRRSAHTHALPAPRQSSPCRTYLRSRLQAHPMPSHS